VGRLDPVKHAGVAVPARPGLKELSANLAGALEDVSVPSYIIDASGVIRWVNQAGVRMVGDVRGL